MGSTAIEEKSLSQQLADRVAETEFDDLPGDIVEGAKAYILDALASGLAGSSTRVSHTLAQQISRWGGREEATAWGTDIVAPAPFAALLNAASVHGFDLDAVHDDATIHAYTSVVPAALATGQESSASGKDLLTGVVLGADTAVRLGLALGVYKGFILTSICGGFGAATAAARTLRLDGDGVLRTLGIQYGQTAGNRQTFLDGGSSTRFQPGFQAQAGVTSAYFAAAGLSGARAVFEGVAGFIALYCESGEPNLDALLEGLGETYRGSEVSIKPYPSCRGTHGPIEATLEIVGANDVPAESISRIVVHVPKNETGIFRLIGAPFVPGVDPHVDAQYSIPYTVAAAAMHGRFFLGEVDDEVILDPAVLDLADRVEIEIDLEAPHGKSLIPVSVTIEQRDGTELTAVVSTIKGHPAKPFSWGDIVKKFEDTVELRGSKGLQKRCSEIVARVEELDTLDNVGSLATLLRLGD
jgi:2-methylcitrate dehydratase PrpD